MLPEDVDTAVAAVRDGGWGDRRAALQFYAQHPATYPFLAESDGNVVGTAVAIEHGTVGWVGLVFVAPELRGQGLGGVLTQAVVERLQERGCRSMLLAATDLGRPVYDRLGFVADGEYVVFGGPVRPNPVSVPVVRPMVRADVDGTCALDREATAEDRSSIIRAIAEGWVIDAGLGPRAYALRSPWGLGPAIAEDPADGVLLLEVLRSHAPGTDMTIVVPGANESGIDHLRKRGFVEQRRLPRMRLGEPVMWRPRQIWSIFSFAMG